MKNTKPIYREPNRKKKTLLPSFHSEEKPVNHAAYHVLQFIPEWDDLDFGPIQPPIHDSNTNFYETDDLGLDNDPLTQEEDDQEEEESIEEQQEELKEEEETEIKESPQVEEKPTKAPPADAPPSLYADFPVSFDNKGELTEITEY